MDRRTLLKTLAATATTATLHPATAGAVPLPQPIWHDAPLVTLVLAFDDSAPGRMGLHPGPNPDLRFCVAAVGVAAGAAAAGCLPHPATLASGLSMRLATGGQPPDMAIGLAGPNFATRAGVDAFLLAARHARQ